MILLDMKQHTVTFAFLSLILMSNVSGQSAATLLKGDEKLGGRKAQAGESITSKLGIEDCTFLYYVDCTQGICYCHLSSVTASEGCEQGDFSLYAISITFL
nr:PREDICTED: uncharacterized protein LOC108213074 [Daucus carota subsp. sativus]